MMYRNDRNGVAKQGKDREPRPHDGWRSGSSSDTAKQEEAKIGKKEGRVRLVQSKGKIKPKRMK